MTTLVVPLGLAGRRADKVVAVLAGISRSQAKQLIEGGEVTVEGQPVAPTDRFEEGTALMVRIPPADRLVPEAVPFVVRYEDPDLAVVDKPAGVVVHPGAGRMRGTLAAGILRRWPELQGVGEEGRWGVVHRLDRDTSGLLIVARSPRALRALQNALAARSIGRSYLALVRGSFEAPTGTIDAPIGRHPRHPTRMTVLDGGRPARTHYRRIAAWRDPEISLLDVRLETGRTHQIRVHLASIGHPLIGDRTYGRGDPDGLDPGRVWLHARRLEFVHPFTGARTVVESPLPDELRSSLAALGPPPTGTIDVSM